MDSKHIEHLLDKYWACETSLEEEVELKDFFNKEEIPKYLQAHAPLFKYLKEENTNPTLGDAFDEEILQTLDQKAGKQVWYEPYFKVAAVLTFLAIASFALTKFLNQQEQSVHLTDTYENPEDAFEETKKALILISKNIGKGRIQTQKIANFHQAEEKIKNNNIEL